MEMPMEVSGGERSRSHGSRSPQARSRPGRPPPPSTVTEINTLAAIKQQKEAAHRLVEQGLSSDEQGRPDEAKAFYQSGLKAVTSVLRVNCEELVGSEEDKETAKQIQQKMNKTKLQIEYRIQALRASEIASPTAPPQTTMDSEAPPSYEDSISSPDTQYAALGDSIMSGEETDGNSLVANASEIFNIPDGVQIFYITPEGYVSAPSYPSALKVFKFHDTQEGASSSQQPSAFLQVGDWYYPLQPGSSPALQSNYGAYLFPDVHAATPGAAVGLMIPETVQAAQRHQFEELMRSLTMMRHQEVSPTEATAPPREVTQGEEVEERETTSTKISKGIITVAEYVSWGVGKGAEKAGSLIKQGSTKLMTRLRPEDNPRPVDPRVQAGIQYVRKGSHTAVQVSSYLVSKLGQATMHLAKEAAPVIRKQGAKYLPKSLQESEKSGGKSTVDSVIEVAASGLAGFGTIYVSLEQAAKVLGKNLACETVQVVSHKYGNEAGQLTENALYSAGNLAVTAHNANNFGIKAVAKRAAKDTGKAVLTDLKDKGKTAPEKPPPPGSGGAINGEKR